MDIDDMTPDQLRELADQKEAELRKKERPKPKSIVDIDLKGLIREMETYFDYIEENPGMVDYDEWKANLFHSLHEKIYGENVLEWVTRQLP